MSTHLTVVEAAQPIMHEELRITEAVTSTPLTAMAIMLKIENALILADIRMDHLHEMPESLKKNIAEAKSLANLLIRLQLGI